MDGTAEEAGKKRDCTEVIEDAHASLEEKAKKLRIKEAPNQKQVEPSTTVEDSTLGETPNASPAGKAKAVVKVKEPTTKGKASLDLEAVVKVKEPTTKGKASLDLEGAFHYVIRMGDCDGNDKEFLTEDRSKWVTFRAGHTGDVSSLASFYRESIGDPNCTPDKGADHEKKVSSVPDDTPLEVWLADGLGGEDAPPSFYALLAEISSADTPKVSRLGAAAILTLAWEDSSRVLRVEWMHVVDNEMEFADLLERRLWLRLSTLSLLSSCELLVVSKDILPSKAGDQQQRTNN
jgi:hypothetical protein